MECELKVTAGQSMVVLSDKSSVIAGNPLEHKLEILKRIEKLLLLIGGEYELFRDIDGGERCKMAQ